MNLTKRQAEIVTLLAQGNTAEQVAQAMHRSVGTVRRHVILACDRVKARNSAHLVGIAISRGWIAPLLLCIVFSVFSPDAHWQRPPRNNGNRDNVISMNRSPRRQESYDFGSLAA